MSTDWEVLNKAALANYVWVPAVTVGLLVAFQADPIVAAGFLICGLCRCPVWSAIYLDREGHCRRLESGVINVQQ